jgi:hypothetical protein
MPTINIWSKVAVAVQSVLGAAKTISAITKANPAVASSTAHALTNGTLVLLKVNGMRQLDYRVVRVANQAANTFELEGVDSTSFDTFTTGTAEAITFGVSCATLQDINPSGGDAEGKTITTIHDDQAYSIPGNRNPVEYAFGSLWDPADAGLAALAAFDNVKGIAAIAFTFSSGAKIYFAAYPSYSALPGGSAGDVVTTSVKLSLRGRLTAYAS